jgi:hypothetical protein
MVSFSDWGFTRPLIHVGYPKALSSWLQDVVFKPDNGFWPAMGPLPVQRQIIDPAPFFYDPSNINQFLVEQLADDRSLIPVISSEMLSGNMRHGGYNADDLAHRLYTTFPEPRILCVIREQKSMIRSLYSEVIKWGMPHSIENFLVPNRPRLAPQYRHEYLQYDGLVSHYQSSFGEENVLVIPYELFLMNPRSFLERLIDFIQLPEIFRERCLQVSHSSVSNAGFSMTNLTLQRWINYWLVSNPYNYSALFREKEKDVWERDEAMVNREKWLPGAFNNYLERKLARTIEKEVSNVFRESNNRLQKLIDFDLADYNYDL